MSSRWMMAWVTHGVAHQPQQASMASLEDTAGVLDVS